MKGVYFRLSWISFALLAGILPLCLIAAPLPPNGAFPNPGFPKYIESGWAEVTNPGDEGHFAIIYNGQAVDQILRNDGNVFTKMTNITSFDCLDSNTYRYMADQTVYPDEKKSTVCITEYANATHRISAVNGQIECPDSPFPTGVEDANSTQTHFVFLRQNGVLAMPTETTCINESNPFIPPLAPIPLKNITDSENSIADMPYPRTFGAPTASGVWKGENIMGLENTHFYAGARVVPNALNTSAPGNLYGLVGQYLSHDCISPTQYVSTSMLTRVFNDGKLDYASACQNGTRIPGPNGIDTVIIEYGQGPNCTIYSIPDPTDAITTEIFTFQFVEPLSSNPSTECVYQTELEPSATNGSVAVFVKGQVIRAVVMVVVTMLALVML